MKKLFLIPFIVGTCAYGYEVQIANMTGAPVMLQGNVTQEVIVKESDMKPGGSPENNQTVKAVGGWIAGDLLDRDEALPPALYQLGADQVLIFRIPEGELKQQVPYGEVHYDFTKGLFSVATSYQVGELEIGAHYEGKPLSSAEREQVTKAEAQKVEPNALGVFALPTDTQACVFYSIGFNDKGYVEVTQSDTECYQPAELQFGSYEVISHKDILDSAIAQAVDHASQLASTRRKMD